MAATAAATRLTEAHARAQSRLGLQIVRQMLLLWDLLDPSDIDATYDRWVASVTPVVGTQRAASSRLAANYLQAFRSLELGVRATPFTPVVDDEVDPAAVATSLLVTGPVSIRRNLARGTSFADAVVTAKANTSRAAMRHVLNGGRSTIERSVEVDRLALGWARVVRGDPCAFCAMLASRGPVYLSEASAEFTRDGKRYHDGCRCTPEPVYREDTEWPGHAREYQALWKRTTKGLSGHEARVAFRRAIEGRSDGRRLPSRPRPDTSPVPTAAELADSAQRASDAFDALIGRLPPRSN